MTNAAGWIEHRRGDGELVGWMRPQGEGFVVVDLLGRDISGELDWLASEELLDDTGIGYLADAYELRLDDGSWMRVRITEVSGDTLRVKRDDFGDITVPLREWEVPFPPGEALRPFTGDASSFDAVAGLYAQARPSYPRAVVEWVLADDPRVVVDVGAGTGLFTRLITAPGRTVFAVEPSRPMLDELSRALTGVVAVEASAEAMPLPDSSADAVFCAQAWHWVDSHAASTEVARVLRPGGSLTLLWNLRDERVPWVRALGAAMRADGDHFRGDTEDPAVGIEFGTAERFFHEWSRELTHEQLLDDVRSRSYFALLTPNEQQRVEDAVARVLADAPSAAGIVALPYVTAAYRYRLATDASV